jgi:hypothetical protein
MSDRVAVRFRGLPRLPDRSVGEFSNAAIAVGNHDGVEFDDRVTFG